MSSHLSEFLLSRGNEGKRRDSGAEEEAALAGLFVSTVERLRKLI